MEEDNTILKTNKILIWRLIILILSVVWGTCSRHHEPDGGNLLIVTAAPTTHLWLVSRSLLSPLIQVPIHITILSSQSRVQHWIRNVKRVHQRNCLTPDGTYTNSWPHPLTYSPDHTKQCIEVCACHSHLQFRQVSIQHERKSCEFCMSGDPVTDQCKLAGWTWMCCNMNVCLDNLNPKYWKQWCASIC